MPKIMIIHTCGECPELLCEHFNKLDEIPEKCPLQNAPDVIVFKNEEYEPEDDESTFFEDVFAALEFKEIPAYLEEIKK